MPFSFFFRQRMTLTLLLYSTCVRARNLEAFISPAKRRNVALCTTNWKVENGRDITLFYEFPMRTIRLKL